MRGEEAREIAREVVQQVSDAGWQAAAGDAGGRLNEQTAIGNCLEGQALVAALEADEEALQLAIRRMLPGERRVLRQACLVLVREIESKEAER